MPLARRWKLYLSIATVAIALDQLSKLWARHALEVGRSVPVIDGYWDWQLSYNPGASFNLFQSATGARIFLSIAALGAIAFVTWMVARNKDAPGRNVAALALVVGGAAGNLIDRLAHGVVTDFTLWHWHEHYYPMFNVADAALVIGVVLLLWPTKGAVRSPRA